MAAWKEGNQIWNICIYVQRVLNGLQHLNHVYSVYVIGKKYRTFCKETEATEQYSFSWQIQRVMNWQKLDLITVIFLHPSVQNICYSRQGSESWQLVTVMKIKFFWNKLLTTVMWMYLSTACAAAFSGGIGRNQTFLSLSNIKLWFPLSPLSYAWATKVLFLLSLCNAQLITSSYWLDIFIKPLSN